MGRYSLALRSPIVWPITVVLLAIFSFVLPSPLAAYEIAVLKSSDIAAYNQTVAGLQAGFSETAKLTVYDLEGDVARGKKLARKIRASDAALVIAAAVPPVGLIVGVVLALAHKVLGAVMFAVATISAIWMAAAYYSR